MSTRKEACWRQNHLRPASKAAAGKEQHIINGESNYAGFTLVLICIRAFSHVTFICSFLSFMIISSHAVLAIIQIRCDQQDKAKGKICFAICYSASSLKSFLVTVSLSCEPPRRWRATVCLLSSFLCLMASRLCQLVGCSPWAPVDISAPRLMLSAWTAKVSFDTCSASRVLGLSSLLCMFPVLFPSSATVT